MVRADDELLPSNERDCSRAAAWLRGIDRFLVSDDTLNGEKEADCPALRLAICSGKSRSVLTGSICGET